MQRARIGLSPLTRSKDMSDATAYLGVAITVACALIFAAGAGFVLLCMWLWRMFFG